ncbi:DUF1801 domain-containing protein [Massilia sp. ST3]|uniref:DUF1801 domain-containing protein n=1 Tax=Massilia sp. ST3 TaxID=2824903 RepID=UPI001B823FD6|nr:DUF1801 domain-containing protein [Massilia sp. ST3]
MAGNKTTASDASVQAYLDAIPDAARRQDCETLAGLMGAAVDAPPVMWGGSIVGFGSYHYRYDSGREGDACLVGFSSRKNDISIYLMGASPNQNALLARLGRHKMGKACLSVRSLADLDLDVLRQLVQDSAAATRAAYPAA